MHREFKVTVHAYTRYPHKFKESHTFSFKATSYQEANKRIATISKKLFPSGEYTVDYILLEDDNDNDFLKNIPGADIEYI